MLGKINGKIVGFCYKMDIEKHGVKSMIEGLGGTLVKGSYVGKDIKSFLTTQAVPITTAARCTRIITEEALKSIIHKYFKRLF